MTIFAYSTCPSIRYMTKGMYRSAVFRVRLAGSVDFRTRRSMGRIVKNRMWFTYRIKITLYFNYTIDENISNRWCGICRYFIGRTIKQSVRSKEIIVYDNMSHNNIRFFFGSLHLEKVKFVKGDILNHIELARQIKEIDVVFHMAGVVKSLYSLEDSLKYEHIYIWGSANLVQSIEKMESVRKLIFLSSASVYGFSGIEIDPVEVNPMNVYGRSKREAEKFVELLSSDIDIKIIRAGNVFGYNRTVRLDSVINRFIFESLCYGRIQIFGNGHQVRPFIHIDQDRKSTRLNSSH